MSFSKFWKLPIDNQLVRDAFFAGECFLYPTEAVWGIGGNPADEKVVEKIICLKQRPVEKGLIMVAGDWAQTTGWVGYLTDADKAEMMQLTQAYPTTFIVEAGEKVAKSLTDSLTARVAIRISQHGIIQQLCALLEQPVISTSANFAGQIPAKNEAQARAIFPQLPLISGQTGGYQQPSRLIDWQNKQFLRE